MGYRGDMTLVQQWTDVVASPRVTERPPHWAGAFGKEFIITHSACCTCNERIWSVET